MSDLRWGSHTEQTYSSDGLINDLHVCSLTEVELMFKLQEANSLIGFATDVAGAAFQFLMMVIS